tara:strand:+ start:2877 stop:3053 length:177 start_codon:yes stop_codon:yes gene_type:complete
MENNHLEKKELQLELPGIKTGHYEHMTKDAINFPSKQTVNNSNKDDLFPEEIQLSLAI